MPGPTPDISRFRHAREVFDRCMDLRGDDLERQLDSLCGGDLQLRAEVEHLLHCDRTGHPLDAPPLLHLTVDENPLQHPERIGSFVVEKFLGSGGSGAVYLAKQHHPARHVAIKLLRSGGHMAARRFQRESQALAVLNHPGIVRILDAGIDAALGGRPFIVMEYVNGEPITCYARSAGLDLQGRLQLFLGVCDAVAHAHSKGIIHRDIKPANILVDADGQVPKVVDFGIARVVSASATSPGTITADSSVLGTLEYMSPECMAVGVAGADTRADVYSLGCVLYELITGEPPRDYSGLSLVEAVQQATARAQLPLDAASRTALARGDLDSIIKVATDREPQCRYQTVASLAADVRRVLASEPILARPPGWRRRAVLWAKRNRAAAAALAAIGIMLIATASLVWSASSREREQYRLAMNAVATLDDMISFMEPQLGTAEQRRRVVEEFLPAVEALVQATDSDDRVELLYARLLRARADVDQLDKRYERVMDDRVHAARILGRQSHRRPDDLDTLWRFSIALVQVGDEAARRHLPEGPLPWYRRALEYQQHAAAKWLLPPPRLDDITWSWLRIASYHVAQRAKASAARTCEEMATAANGHVRQFPGRVGSWWTLMVTELCLSRERLLAGDRDGSELHVECAEQIGRRLVAADPTNRLILLESMRASLMLARAKVRRGVPIGDVADHVREIDRLAELVERHGPLSRLARGAVLVMDGFIAAERGDHRFAAELAEDATTLFEPGQDDSEIVLDLANGLTRWKLAMPALDAARVDFIDLSGSYSTGAQGVR